MPDDEYNSVKPRQWNTDGLPKRDQKIIEHIDMVEQKCDITHRKTGELEERINGLPWMLFTILKVIGILIPIGATLVASIWAAWKGIQEILK